MRVLGVISLVCASLWGAAAFADEPAESGSAKLAAYVVCHPLATIDMDAAGSEAATECNGIVRNLDPQKQPDNLAIHCLEDTSSRPDGYKYSGTCVQTDSDGDRIYMTYDGQKDGEVKWVGGTGKHQGVAGSGKLGVMVAPDGKLDTFAYTLTYDINWTRKAK